MSLDELKREHNSRPRNPKIAKACFMAGYIDAWGRGTLKIINSCKASGLPEPEIAEKDGGIMVTLHKSGQVGGQDGGQVGDQIQTLTPRQQDILKLIIENPKISRKELSVQLGINESAVQKHTDALKKKNIIEREGETTGYWIIKTE
jgi:ATP-dependent DNA helicase RecG